MRFPNGQCFGPTCRAAIEADWQSADRWETLIGGCPSEVAGAKGRFRGRN
jgi:hypothetical protein